MNLKYKVELSDAEREELKSLLAAGTAPARKLRRAQILLKSDSSAEGPAWGYEAICTAFDVSNVTVSAVRKAYCEGGVEAALTRKPPNREYQPRLDGAAEAHLIALACSEPPLGEIRWSLRLLRDKLLELEYVDSVSHETVRQVLKKMNLNLG